MRPACPPAALLPTVLATILLAAPVLAADRYEETRDLRVDAATVTRVVVDVGAGSLGIRGDEGAQSMTVTATVWVEDHPRDPERVRAALAEHVDIRLEADGDEARLVATTRDPGIGYSLPHVDLEVVVPRGVDLDITDESGWLRVRQVAGNVQIDDGSGSIELSDIGGHVAIDDGSGSIDVAKVAGRIGIEDESGSIDVEGAEGDLAIDDGSGSIAVRDVQGSVTIRDGSGSIVVAGVGRDLHVLESGSGSVSFLDVAGAITVDD